MRPWHHPAMTSTDELHVATAAHRRLAADLFDDLTPEQARTTTLCGAWTAHDMAAHLVMPFEVSAARLGLEVVRQRGSADKASEAMVARLARRPLSALSATLRARADEHPPIPVVGPHGQHADTAIHLRDVARPLGRPDDVPLSSWRTVLDFLLTWRGQIGHTPRGVSRGLALAATDQEWAAGSGEEVSGPSEALAMALAGRPAALGDLHGPGVEVLRERIGSWARPGNNDSASVG